MNRAKLLSNINYALNHIQYGEEREKEVKKAFKKLKEDLKRLSRIEKDLKYMATQNVERFLFPNGRIILGIDITNIPSEEIKFEELVKNLLRRLDND